MFNEHIASFEMLMEFLKKSYRTSILLTEGRKQKLTTLNTREYAFFE